MARGGGAGEPPEGGPDGGGEDEYRAVVFDESFVRAARLQEFSAQERVDDHSPAVRTLAPRPEPERPPARTPLSRQALTLIVLVALAFGAAVFMGTRQPSPGAPSVRAGALRTTIVPLAPTGPVPGGRPAELLAAGPARAYRAGEAGLPLPPSRRTAHFTDGQVLSALFTAKDFVARSSLDASDVSGADPNPPVRALVDPDQLAQFDRSLGRPAADGRHAATGWLIRLDPRHSVLADPEIRVRGGFAVRESSADALEVTSDHTFVYTLRPAGDPDPTHASLFTVRRTLHFRFDRRDLREHRAELMTSELRAGPLSCADDASGRLRPLLAGQRAPARGPAATDPYARGPEPAALCGTLATPEGRQG
ncbi:hypothetical protein [Streptomyces sp. NPDC060194]|uniref:SCO2583 family membrane protein n=1 Tax=Streptomyces sp. NPDC060194 TaxID=3347069 RepID=UPI0036676FE7